MILKPSQCVSNPEIKVVWRRCCILLYYCLNSQDETEAIDYSDCTSHVTGTSSTVMDLTTIRNIIRKLINTPSTVHYVGNINPLWHVGEVGQKCLYFLHHTYVYYRGQVDIDKTFSLNNRNCLVDLIRSSFIEAFWRGIF